MEEALKEATGLRESARKIIIYWTLATHSLPHVSTFPLIVLLGKMATGKSQTLHIIQNFARRPIRLSLRGMTTPTIRDKLVEAYNGTAIVEEADFAWRDADTTFERLLSDRYQRATAAASHKVKSVDKNWASVDRQYFGATALHRRIPFKDAALDGRTVFVLFHTDHSRQYREFDPHDAGNEEGRQLVRGFELKPVNIVQPKGIAGRIFNTYKPLLSAAKACGDEDFVEQMYRKILVQQALELKEAQASEPDGLVLQAIVEVVCATPLEQFRNIKLSDLAEAIWRNHRVSLSPRQIGPIVRGLGFETKVSHGVSVAVPTAPTLLKACDEQEYTDEAVEELRRATLIETDKPKE